MKVFPFTEEVVLRVIDENELTVRLHTSYTGRGMQGVLADKTCIGFVVPDAATFRSLLIWLACETDAEGVDVEDLIEVARTERTDNLGHELIVYYPDYVRFAEPAEDEEPSMVAASRKLGTLLGGPRTINQSISGTVYGSALMIGSIEGEVNR